MARETGEGETQIRRLAREYAAPILAGLALAAPTLLARFPPMTDLPLHDALVGLLRHLHDPAFFPPDLYRLNLGHPNQLFHLSAWGLSYLFGVDGGCKVVIALAQVGILVGGARLTRYLGRSAWSALALAPLAMGWSYFWGLVANLVGFAMLLFALPTLDRAVSAPSARGFLKSSLWMVVLYLAHESVMVVACSAVLVFTLGQPLQRRATALRLAPIGVALVIFVTHLIVQARMIGVDKGGVSTVDFRGIWPKVNSIPVTLTGSLDIVSRTALFTLALLCLLVLAMERWRAHDEPAPRSFAPFVHRYRFELTALVNAIAYFVMPFGMAGGTLFNHRFYHPAYALLVVSIGPLWTRRRLSLLARAIVATLPAAILLIDWPQFVESDHLARGLDGLIPDIEMNSSLVFLEADPVTGTRIFVSSTSGARTLAQRGGRLLHSLTSSAIAPVHVNPAFEWPEAEGRVSASTMKLRPEHDVQMFRYLLVHSRDPSVALLVRTALGDDAHFVDLSGEWILFESSRPRIPIDSPELPMPSPAPHTLGWRMKQLMASLRDGGAPAPAAVALPADSDPGDNDPDGGAGDSLAPAL
jgi:hypothetical protein